MTASSRDSPIQQTLGLDAGVIIARDLDTPNGRLLQGAWLPNDGGLVYWSTGPAPCPPPSVRANSTRRLSPSTAVRNAASACGMTETGRAVLGWGWLGLAGLGWGHWKPGTARPGPPASCPSAWPYSTLITEPCPAHHLGPVPARDQEGLDAARPAASTNRSILSDQRATAPSVCLPACLSVCAAPPPSAYVLCRTLRCEGLMLAHHAARTVALSSRPPACGDEIAVSCRFPPVFSLYLPMADSPARPAISSCT